MTIFDHFQDAVYRPKEILKIAGSSRKNESEGGWAYLVSWEKDGRPDDEISDVETDADGRLVHRRNNGELVEVNPYVSASSLPQNLQFCNRVSSEISDQFNVASICHGNTLATPAQPALTAQEPQEWIFVYDNIDRACSKLTCTSMPCKTEWNHAE